MEKPVTPCCGDKNIKILHESYHYDVRNKNHMNVNYKTHHRKVVYISSRELRKGKIVFISFIIMYNDGVYTRWRPPQQRIASLGGYHRV